MQDSRYNLSKKEIKGKDVRELNEIKTQKFPARLATISIHSTRTVRDRTCTGSDNDPGEYKLEVRGEF